MDARMLAELTVNPFASSRPIVQVTSDSAGIGDHLLTLAMANGIRQRLPGMEVIYSAEAWVYPWLALFDGADQFSPERLPGVLTFHCEHSTTQPVYFERGISRWEYWEEILGSKLVIPSLRPFKQSVAEWAIPFSGRVVLVPFAAYPERTWPLDRWIEVERLLISQGFKCVILDTERERNAGFSSPVIINAAPHCVAAVIKNAVCFAGNDSGLAHLAGMIGTPGVAVCSSASDANIYGYAPSIRELGGRWRNCVDVHPHCVVKAIEDQIIKHVGDFPVAEFVGILEERDWPRNVYWFPIYSTLFRVVRDLQPKSIVEIGVRAGYSAWTMLRACPQASVYGIDFDGDEREVDASGGFKGACRYAMRLLKDEKFELLIADSHTLDKVPECDLLYVDGDHSSSGAYQDLLLAEKSNAKIILVDDYTHIPGIRDACTVFMRARPHLKGRFISSTTGLYLIEIKEK
jgi:Methyltransferase domain/Glycosyltransferase family 9 (heptosyltransferase)